MIISETLTSPELGTVRLDGKTNTARKFENRLYVRKLHWFSILLFFVTYRICTYNSRNYSSGNKPNLALGWKPLYTLSSVSRSIRLVLWKNIFRVFFRRSIVQRAGVYFNFFNFFSLTKLYRNCNEFQQFQFSMNERKIHWENSEIVDKKLISTKESEIKNDEEILIAGHT